MQSCSSERIYNIHIYYYIYNYIHTDTHVQMSVDTHCNSTTDTAFHMRGTVIGGLVH